MYALVMSFMHYNCECFPRAFQVHILYKRKISLCIDLDLEVQLFVSTTADEIMIILLDR